MDRLTLMTSSPTPSRPRRIAVLLFGLLCLMLLAGCSMFSSNELLSVGDTGHVRCSTDCQNRAQCGVIEGANQQVVLGGLNTQRVAPGSHDAYFTDGSDVTIQGVQSRNVQLQIPPINGTPNTPFELPFYNVVVSAESGSSNQSGWVAAFCVRGDGGDDAPTPTLTPTATPFVTPTPQP